MDNLLWPGARWSKPRRKAAEHGFRAGLQFYADELNYDERQVVECDIARRRRAGLLFDRVPGFRWFTVSEESPGYFVLMGGGMYGCRPITSISPMVGVVCGFDDYLPDGLLPAIGHMIAEHIESRINLG